MADLNRIIDMASRAVGKAGGSSGSSGGLRDKLARAAGALGGGQQASTPSAPVRPGASAGSEADRQAVARYDYLMQTADPQHVEQIHRDAFERLTPQQRTMVADRMRTELPAHEQPRSAEPADLARSATRQEMSRPGSMRGLLAGAGVGAAAGGLLGLVAGGAIASAVAAPMLADAVASGVDFDALAGGLDLGALSGVDELAAGAGEGISGVGEQLGGFGEQLSDFGLGDLFGR